jgi:hypothetical protein
MSERLFYIGVARSSLRETRNENLQPKEIA